MEVLELNSIITKNQVRRDSTADLRWQKKELVSFQKDEEKLFNMKNGKKIEEQ